MEWETIVSGLVGALLGGVLVAFLHIWHERGEKIRERKIEAADELVAATVLALLAIRDAGQAARAGDAAGAIVALQAARERRDEIHARFARVLLLFGADAPATVEAAWIAQHVEGAVSGLEREPESKRHREAASEARAANNRFSRHARADINSWMAWRRSDSEAGAGGAGEHVGD